MSKDLIKKLGEETIYSSKGHFKACDIRRNAITLTIWICAMINVIGVSCFPISFGQILSVIGLLGTIALLIWNQGEGKNYRQKHKQAGEKYLALHKQARGLFYDEDSGNTEVQELNKKVSDFDKRARPEIPWMARKWAQKAIRKYGETDNWFKG